ncbi:unnamed protein product [Paramecium pentaurelia]|uniref:Uncharacterized protein n=1 Tax=Paramecium pentaurelia TaxID=43138 RepID=A0A8S1YPG6_9CILI|nr:unnamed protein product [Paramecium pentaurelia]
MEILKCKDVIYENEEIIRFCLNQSCQNTTQYCYECLNTTNSEHHIDCIRFSKIIQFIKEFVLNYNQKKIQFYDISKNLQNISE